MYLMTLHLTPNFIAVPYLDTELLITEGTSVDALWLHMHTYT